MLPDLLHESHPVCTPLNDRLGHNHQSCPGSHMMKITALLSAWVLVRRPEDKCPSLFTCPVLFTELATLCYCFWAIPYFEAYLLQQLDYSNSGSIGAVVVQTHFLSVYSVNEIYRALYMNFSFHVLCWFWSYLPSISSPFPHLREVVPCRLKFPGFHPTGFWLDSFQ